MLPGRSESSGPSSHFITCTLVARTPVSSSTAEDAQRRFNMRSNPTPAIPGTVAPHHAAIMKGGRFSKFCNDVQISRKVPQQQLNLMFMAQVKAVPKSGITLVKRKAMQSKALTFIDFLDILHTVAPSVYPRSSSSVDAFRRLLLENVLPLAVTRPFVGTTEFLDADESAGRLLLSAWDPAKHGEDIPERLEPQKLAHFKRMERGLQGIFDFYVTKCVLRTNGEVSAEVNRRRAQSGSTAQVATATRKEAKQLAKNQKKIGFCEAMAFAQDYDIFSSDANAALLTTHEMANVYLTTVEMDAGGSEAVPLIDYHQFLQLFARMAIKGYDNQRHRSVSDPSLPASPVEKLKALMLHMWKVVNHPRKAKAVMGDVRTCPCMPPTARLPILNY